MESDSTYLFIYGTLLNAHNPYGVFLKAHSQLVAHGYFKGLLYNCGEYPGAFYQPTSSQKVWGDIVLLDNPAKVLKVIDEYEGYGPNEVQPNLFVREVVPVVTDNAELTCWVYLYGLAVEGLEMIQSGRFCKTKNALSDQSNRA